MRPDSLLNRRCLSVAWLCVAPIVGGCVATDLEAPSANLPCVANEAAAPGPHSIMQLTMDDGKGYLVICSAVAISRQLVLTAASCLFDRLDRFPSAPDRMQICDPAKGWSPREPGDFSARLGPAFDYGTIWVAPSDDLGTMIPVLEARTSGTTTRCEDDLAIVVLDLPTSVPPAILRLDDVSVAGEPVVLSSLPRMAGDLSTIEVETSVAQVTSNTGSEMAPPRSLLLDGKVCASERGGAAFSARSTALIGILTWGWGACDAADGMTVAARLAPFRRFLAETAADYGQSLRAEPNPVSLRELSACE
jgi:hypothetical protein